MLNLKSTVTITIIDQVNAVVTGLVKEHTKLLWNKYGYLVKDYYFMPRYRLGRWDGKVRYFSKTGNTYIHLLPEIIKLIYKFGYSVKLIDNRSDVIVLPKLIDEDYFSDYKHPEDNVPIILREHQVDAVNAALDEGNGIIEACTGSGKTLMVAAICRQLTNINKSIIIVVPNITLISQTRKVFDDLSINNSEYSGNEKNLGSNICISTWQALQHAPIILKQYDCVIVDECHKLTGQQLQNIVNDYGSHMVYRFGLTGTLPKNEADNIMCKIALGPVRYKISARTLIDKGLLADLHIDVLQLVEDFLDPYQQYKEESHPPYMTYKQFKNSYFPDYRAEKQYLSQSKPRLLWISEFVKTKLQSQEKSNTLILVDSVNMGKKLHERIENSHFLYGKDKDKVRQAVYDLFKDNDDIIVIATVGIAGVGLSITRMFNLVVIDGGKSFIRIIQSIGRGLRKGGDKQMIHIYDICSDLHYASRHARERSSFYKEVQYPQKTHKINYENGE